VEHLNQRWLDYTGMTAGHAAGWGWTEVHHPDDRKGIVEIWQSCVASGAPANAEARIRRYDGAYQRAV
jgi:PAS domain-containing protein